jgi:hypothetical protein
MAAELFSDFWQLYPRKVGKREARKKWEREMRAGTDPLEIITGLERQLPELMSREPQFRPHPATWLNQGRWEDEPAPSAIKTTTGNVYLDNLMTGRAH